MPPSDSRARAFESRPAWKTGSNGVSCRTRERWTSSPRPSMKRTVRACRARTHRTARREAGAGARTPHLVRERRRAQSLADQRIASRTERRRDRRRRAIARRVVCHIVSQYIRLSLSFFYPLSPSSPSVLILLRDPYIDFVSLFFSPVI